MGGKGRGKESAFPFPQRLESRRVPSEKRGNGDLSDLRTLKALYPFYPSRTRLPQSPVYQITSAIPISDQKEEKGVMIIFSRRVEGRGAPLSLEAQKEKKKKPSGLPESRQRFSSKGPTYRNGRAGHGASLAVLGRGAPFFVSKKKKGSPTGKSKEH